jgi:hypothetical protein
VREVTVDGHVVGLLLSGGHQERILHQRLQVRGDTIVICLIHSVFGSMSARKPVPRPRSTACDKKAPSMTNINAKRANAISLRRRCGLNPLSSCGMKYFWNQFIVSILYAN